MSPLAGRRVLVPETRELDLFQRMLEERGAEVVRCPLVAILDARGDNLDSAGLAELLRKWREQNRTAVCFVIGGADGLAQALRARATQTVAFGTATWPHQLVRVMLLEQLYRAGTILAGHPYHRA